MAAPAEQTSHGSFPETLSAAFRALPIPVIGRVEAGEFRLDVRCLKDENTFVEQLPRLSF